MSYTAAAALQAALYHMLTTAPALAGVAVVDGQPDPAPTTFVLIGPEEVRDASDKSGAGAVHRLTLSVITDAAGFLAAKSLAGEIAALMQGTPPVLDAGRIVEMQFLRGVARRIGDGARRRIDLMYHIRIET